MTLLDALADYRRHLSSDVVSDRYSALGFALQLPGICGRLEFPFGAKGSDGLYNEGGRPFDRAMFVRWFHEHRERFLLLSHGPYLSIEDIARDLYGLRNALTHEGVVKGFCEHVVLVDDASERLMTTGRFLFVPLQSFCGSVFDVAESVIMDYECAHGSSVQLCSDSGCGVDLCVYKQIDSFVEQQFVAFWEKRGRIEHALNMVYELVFLEDTCRCSLIEKHFSDNPDEPYVIEQIDTQSAITFPDDIVCFSKKYPRFCCPSELRNGIVLRVTKSQFEDMQRIHKVLMDYGKSVNDRVADMLKLSAV